MNIHQRHSTYPQDNVRITSSILATASHEELSESRNPIFRTLLQENNTLSKQLASAERSLEEKTKSLEELTIKLTVTESKWSELLSKLPALQTTSGPDGILLATKPELTRLSQEDYPKVKIWSERDWASFLAERKKKVAATDGLATQKRRPGRPRKTVTTADNTDSPDDDNHFYWLPDINGIPVSEKQQSRMRGIAAGSWGLCSDTATEFVIRGLQHEYIEFHLDSDRWKVEKFITLKYPGWARTHFEVENPRKRKKSSDNALQGTSSVPTPMDIDDTPLLSQNPSPEHNSDPSKEPPSPEQAQAPAPPITSRASLPHSPNLSEESPNLFNGQDTPIYASRAVTPMEIDDVQPSHSPNPGEVSLDSPDLHNPSDDDTLYDELDAPDEDENNDNTPSGRPILGAIENQTAASSSIVSLAAPGGIPVSNPPSTASAKPARQKKRKECLPTQALSKPNYARLFFCQMQKESGKNAYEDEFQEWYKSSEAATHIPTIKEQLKVK
ncbi:hypothetical protein V5O48_016042 [Marasmius crinis-equi]|uniref:No apical meristem-associated C-terminal domain-containing protein n=1 Tax=Marasmius crinis-equi TaxID=585013 RepID=A0ABR3ESU0_9AGAR